MLTRDEILRIYAQGPEAVVALVEGLLTVQAAQAAELAELRDRMQRLEDRIAKDSHNSHQPPSRDLPPKPKSLRRASERQPGGQPGHRGTTLAWCAEPDAVVVHHPTTCANCGAALETAPVVGDRRRQVVDLPVLRLATTEQVVERRCCAACGQVTQAAFPPEARGPVRYGPRLRGLVVYLNQYQLLPVARIQTFLADLFSCSLSVGTVARAVADCDAALAATETTIQQALQQAPVAHFDETGLRVAGTQQWVHVASTDQWTHYHVHPRRGAAGMEAAGVLPGFGGVAVHDGLHGYRTFACGHALCNVHHLRELTFIAEQYQQAWAADGKALLQELQQAVATAHAAGQDHLAPALVTRAHQRYRALARAGLAANPPTPKARGAPGPPKRSPGGKLAERLGRYETEALTFLADFRVPFDNNQAERDLRMVKVRQKISGGFRTTLGAAQFARLRGYLSTAHKQGHSPLLALQTACAGHPLVLAGPE
jgi:transposase